MIRILVTVFAALLGLAFGSFLNVCLSRWPEGESVVKPRSHCRICERTLAWWENVPLLSWLALRGRCRGCQTWISVRYPLVEAAVGVLWASVGWHFTTQLMNDRFAVDLRYSVLIPAIETAIGMAIFYFLMVGLAVLDAEHLWLPDAVTIPGIVAGFLYSILLICQSRRYGTGQPLIWQAIGERLLAIVVAAAIVLLIRWVYWLIRRHEGMGLGDAKLMALLAAWLGLPSTLLAFGLGVLMGAVVGLVFIALPSARRAESNWAMIKLPLGTFLCIGGIISGLWGPQIISAYLTWVGL